MGSGEGTASYWTKYPEDKQNLRLISNT